MPHRCSLFYFYIKPQQDELKTLKDDVVPYSISTSNHNDKAILVHDAEVVPYSISTSNHNLNVISVIAGIVVPYSISTSNHNVLWSHRPALFSCSLFYFYIKPQPAPVAAAVSASCSLFYFYIKPQLYYESGEFNVSCSLFYFYIKPQLWLCWERQSGVVPYSISTSNHNCRSAMSPATSVVPYSISTSNHNRITTIAHARTVVPYSISTSNHNYKSVYHSILEVVPYSISTSNHNEYHAHPTDEVLFLILFLHQTTTAKILQSH